MSSGLFNISGESGVANSHQRAGADSLGTTVMQTMNLTRLEFPAHYRFRQIRVTRIPSMDKQARRIHFPVFAFNFEFHAVGTYAT